jgi:hypothetical protein
MAMSGIPIFVAAPCHGSACTPECVQKTQGAGVKAGYHFPANWEATRADPSAVNAWQPGLALCAVGGHSCDFLDVDPRNGGAESSEALWQAGKWPNPYGQQITPSGGRHEIIQPLRTGKGTPAPGIDVQGGRLDGTGRGFVFLAPTVRASKVDGIPRPYRWTVEPDLPRLLQWTGEQSGAALAELVPQSKGKHKVNSPEDASGFFHEETPHTTLSADRTIASKAHEITEHIRTKGWGGFRTTLNGAAFTLGAYVGSGYMTYEQAFHVIASAIQLAGYPINEESAQTVEVGLNDGAARPIRVVEPRPLGGRSTVSSEGFGARLISVDDLDDVPDPEPLIDGWLYKNTVARLIGQPGAYKSFLALDMACCVASGRPWHGRKVERTAVLYVVGEGLSGYKRRVAAWCAHNGVDRAELRENLRLTRGAVQIGGEEWESMVRWCVDSKAGFVIMDTQAKATIEFDENSNPEQTRVIALLESLRAETGGTLLLLHHTGHANGEAGNRGRGASAWRGGVDTELILTKTGERTGSLRNDRQKEAVSGQEVAVTMVAALDSLAVKIEDRAPLNARSQWLADQVASGVRFASQVKLQEAMRAAGHTISNGAKGSIFDEYHRLVSEATSRSYDPNLASVPHGGMPFVVRSSDVSE